MDRVRPSRAASTTTKRTAQLDELKEIFTNKSDEYLKEKLKQSKYDKEDAVNEIIGAIEDGNGDPPTSRNDDDGPTIATTTNESSSIGGSEYGYGGPTIATTTNESSSISSSGYREGSSMKATTNIPITTATTASGSNQKITKKRKQQINETVDTVIATTVVAPTSITTANNINKNTNSNISEKKKLRTLAEPDFVCTKCKGNGKTYNGHGAKHKKSCLNAKCNKVTTTIIERIRQIVGSSIATYCALQIALGSYCIDTSTFFSGESAWSTLSVAGLFRRQALGQRLIAALTQSAEGELTAEEKEYTEICPEDIDADGKIDFDVYADDDVDDDDDDGVGGDIDSAVGIDIDSDDDTDVVYDDTNVGVNGVVAGTINDRNNINNEYVEDDNDNNLHIEENDDLYQEDEQLEPNEDDLNTDFIQVAGGGELPELRTYFADQKSKEIEITTPFAMDALKVLTKSGNFFCIDGPHSDVFENRDFTTGDVMYAMKEEEQNVIKKYGQTPNMNNREYTEEELLRVRITTYFDNLKCEVEINLRKVVIGWVQTMSNSKELHAHQQKIFVTIRDGLIDYGVIKAMARQLCEMGANIEFTTTRLDPMEICMSDTSKIDERKQRVKDAIHEMKPIVETMTSTTEEPIKTIIVSSQNGKGAKNVAINHF